MVVENDLKDDKALNAPSSLTRGSKEGSPAAGLGDVGICGQPLLRVAISDYSEQHQTKPHS